MQWILVGLGNPGSEYVGTRHNVGREMLQQLVHEAGINEWKVDKKLRAQATKGEIDGKKVLVVLPDTYMNSSGAALKTLVLSKKQAEQTVVLHDDLDIPLGKIKLSFGSGAGGHKGVESIHKAVKTKDIVRIRIGISPATPKGKLKKPDSEQIVDFVLGTFKPSERAKLETAKKNIHDAITLLLGEGRAKAMTDINSR